jgi:hypothetical protein
MPSMRGVFIGSMGLILAACGGTTSGSSGSLASCIIPAGTYAASATVAAGGSSLCPPLTLPSTLTATDSESLADVASNVMATESGCSTQSDGATCTESVNCSIAEDAITEQVSLTLTLDGDSVSGQATVTVIESGQTELACTYDITLKKS